MANPVRSFRFALSCLGGALLLVSGASAEVPKPELMQAKGEQCVENTDFMRRNHMDLLKHQRDETMHRGIRTKKYSLANCINCHVTPGADGQPVSLESGKHFCSSCHQYAAVQLDCFQCHATQPDEAGMKPVANR